MPINIPDTFAVIGDAFSSRNGHDSGQGAGGADGFVKILEILRV
jgi:hypothetical protein